jgi:choline dehydrogenase
MAEPLSADVVVVGSGSGGAVVARRLVDAGVRVVLVEAGERLLPSGLFRVPAREKSEPRPPLQRSSTHAPEASRFPLTEPNGEPDPRLNVGARR